MKELVMNTVKYLAIGTLLSLGVLASLTLFLAMPDILRWVAGYLGGMMTYGLFTAGVLLAIAWLINHAK